MNTTQITRGGGGEISIPLGFIGNTGLGDNPEMPRCQMPSTGASHMDFKKMLAELTCHHNPEHDQFVAFDLCLPNSRAFGKHPDQITYDRWVEQLQSAAWLYGDTKHNKEKDSLRHHPQHAAVNGGALVLDTTRGELVNAAKMTPKEILEAKVLAASKSHSEAERRRRERINTHLTTLRTLLPSSTKTDKASLLAEVINQVKVLNRQVSELYELGSPIPTDVGELVVEEGVVVVAYGEGRAVVKATLCCDDRPNLIPNLVEAFDSLGLRALRAEISTLAGRVKSVIFATLKDVSLACDQERLISSIREALRQVIERPPGEMVGITSKRQRLASH